MSKSKNLSAFANQIGSNGLIDSNEIPITDAGNFYTGTNVETALQESATVRQSGTGAFLQTKNSVLLQFVTPQNFGAIANGSSNLLSTRYSSLGL
jgi:hypothetical protein